MAGPGCRKCKSHQTVRIERKGIFQETSCSSWVFSHGGVKHVESRLTLECEACEVPALMLNFPNRIGHVAASASPNKLAESLERHISKHHYVETPLFPVELQLMSGRILFDVS